MPLKQAELFVKLTAEQTGGSDFGGPHFMPEIKKTLQLAAGTAANQADVLWTDKRSVASGANDDIDLAGALSDAFGQVITMAEVVALVVMPDAANTTVLSMGGGSNSWTAPWLATGDGIKLSPGAMLVLAAPDANGLGPVVAGTGDVLRIANAAGPTANYSIAVLARSVA
jgi:hypothetical protein